VGDCRKLVSTVRPTGKETIEPGAQLPFLGGTQLARLILASDRDGLLKMPAIPMTGGMAVDHSIEGGDVKLSFAGDLRRYFSGISV
jgi:hypothetical protein